jgi:hypothetical protein
MTAEHVRAAPDALEVIPEGIPPALKLLPQFLCWDWEMREGRWTKPPLKANGTGYAKSTNPATWSSFADAYAAVQKAHWAGIGFALAKAGNICFIDLDHCRDPETGEIAPWALAIIKVFGHTYIEVSPSGTGVKILGYGRLPDGASHTSLVANASAGAKIEMFDCKKYTTLSGHRLAEAAADLADIQDQLDELYWELFPRRESPNGTGRADGARSSSMSDGEILTRALAAKNGAKFSRLFINGDLSEHGGDQSVADLALCAMLAFWPVDAAGIDRLFRRSALMREKWDEVHYAGGKTYGAHTIAEALARQTEHWSPPGPTVHANGRKAGSQANDEDHGGGGGEAPPPPNDGDQAGEEATPSDGDDQALIFAQEQHLPTISAQAWEAIQKANEPVRIVLFGDMPTRIDRAEDGSPSPQPLTEGRLLHELRRAASWWKYQKDPTTGELKKVTAKPPRDVAQDMLDDDSFPLPGLLGIVHTPIFAKDGSLHSSPGYHPATKLFYDPPKGVVISEIPDNPDVEDVETAKALIVDDLLGEFPFTDQADRANAICLFIEIVARNLISGPTPLHMISSPTPGTGKGLLSSALLRHAVGRKIGIMPAANDDDEWRKRITSQLVQMPPAILIDNIVKPIDSGALAGVLTADDWADRKLGVTTILHLPVRCLWVATANNPTMSTEIARRTVQIHLDPKIDRPWTRSGFRHADLRGWIDANRGRLIWAALVLIRNWMRQGGQLSAKRLGSYEAWASVMGGILEAAEIEGFLDNAESFYETADAEGALWREFVKAWAERFGEQETGVFDLFSLAETVDGFDFGRGSERAQKTAFGISLNRQRDRVIGDYRIVFVGTKQRAKRWRLLSTRPGANPFGSFYQQAEQKTDPKPDESVNLVNVSEPLYPNADAYERETISTVEPDVHLGSQGSLISAKVPSNPWDDLPPAPAAPEEEYDPWSD